MAGPRTNDRGEIQRTGNGNGGEPKETLASLLTAMGPQIKLAFPKHLDADRMTRIALTALRTVDGLAQCDKWSFAACVLQAAQLGLEVSTPLGHAYLIPRKNNKRGGVVECTLQLGYQGMIELARRSGQVSTIYAYTVHRGDEFSYELGLEPKLKHVPNVEAEQSEKTMTFVYAVAALRSGATDRQFVILTKRQVDERKARGAGGPAWKSDYLAMARKTAVRALFTWLPKSPEMARAERIDDQDAREPLANVIDTSVTDQLAEARIQAPPVIDAGEEPLDYLRNAITSDGFLAAVKANASWIEANSEQAWPLLREQAARFEVEVYAIEVMLADERER